MATRGTTPGATRFITATITTGAEASAEAFTTVPGQQPGLSTETPRRLEDTPRPTARAASARAPSAGTTMGDKRGAFRPTEARVTVEEARVAAEGRMAAVVGIIGR